MKLLYHGSDDNESFYESKSSMLDNIMKYGREKCKTDKIRTVKS